MPKITIAIQCHNFQRRLCWMLSSLQGQDVIVDIAHMVDNGSPTTEVVIRTHRTLGLNIRSRAYTDMDRFEVRGYTRNDQLTDCTTPWILFADTDMVYHGRYFRRLARELDAGFRGILIAGRMSNRMQDARSLVHSEMGTIVERPFTKASKLELIRRSNVGAGYFQLVQVGATGGVYVPEGGSRDWRWSKKGQKAKSDMQFRRRINNRKRLPRWFSRHQIHLNHRRDSDVGHHVECQR